jgi:hypothetical protein
VAVVHGIASVRFVDGAGIPAAVAVNFVTDDTTTLSGIASAAGTLVNKEHAISDDAITGVEVTLLLDITETLTSGAETPEGVNIAMETSAPSRDWTIWIPSLKDSLVVGGKVVIASGAIFDFAAELASPTGDLTWETPYLNAYTALESAAKSSHKSRKLNKISKSENPV